MCGLTQTSKREVPLPFLWGDLNEVQNPFNQRFREQTQHENKLNKVFFCLNCLHSGFQWGSGSLAKEGQEGGWRGSVPVGVTELLCLLGCSAMGILFPVTVTLPGDARGQCIPAMPLSHPAPGDTHHHTGIHTLFKHQPGEQLIYGYKNVIIM